MNTEPVTDDEYITQVRSMLFEMYRNYEQKSDDISVKMSDGSVALHYPGYYEEGLSPKVEIYSYVFAIGAGHRRSTFSSPYEAYKAVKSAYLKEISRDYEAERQERAEAWDNYNSQMSTTVPDI